MAYAYRSGGAGTDSLEGGTNQDWITGGGGNDFLSGFKYADAAALGISYADLLKRDDADYLNGGSGNDTAWGGGGADSLLGGAGDDVLVGGCGADQLWGGAGKDRFEFGCVLDGNRTPDTGFAAAGTADVIRDFESRGVDSISLKAWKTNFWDGFTFCGQTAAETSDVLQANYRHEGGNTILSLYKPGDAVADGEVLIIGTHFLTSTDFV